MVLGFGPLQLIRHAVLIEPSTLKPYRDNDQSLLHFQLSPIQHDDMEFGYVPVRGVSLNYKTASYLFRRRLWHIILQ